MDPITQQQLLTIGGAAEGEYIDNVFSTKSWMGGYTGSVEPFPVNNGIALGSGNAGRSVLFNAANKDYIGLPSHADLAIGTDDFTIEAWVYHIGNFPSYAGIFGPWTGTGDNAWILEAVGSGTTSDLEFYYYKTDGTFQGPIQGAALTKNQWHHVAVCRSANTIRVFIDGTMYGSGSSNSDNIRQGASIATIGGHVAGTGGNWNGYISNLRYVKGQGLYTANFTPSTEALTTTSQGVTASNVKLLCCNQTTVTGYDKSFGTLTRGSNENDGQGGPNPREYGPFTAAPTTDNSGGLVWMKNRGNGTQNVLMDTVRGRTKWFPSNDTTAESTVGNIANGITSFDNSGFTIGENLESLNAQNENVVAWTFRKQKNFFDIVTWTGNTDTDQVISHSLGSAPGFITCRKRTGGTWFTYHRSCGDTKHLRMNAPNGEATTSGGGSWSVGASSFTAPGSLSLNDDGDSYIAYIFAHDAGGFGENGAENAIQCGTYDGTGNDNLINMGWQPQWMMTKGVDGSGASSTNWVITDILRGWRGHDDVLLDADQTNGDYSNVATGMLRGNGVELNTTYQNASGIKYVYVAIRASDGVVGKRPAMGVDAFQATFGSGLGWDYSQAYTTQTGWDPDWMINKIYTAVNQAGSNYDAGARIRFKKELRINSSNAEGQQGTYRWDKNIPTGGARDGSSFNQHYESWMWNKGPGFDTLTYKGNGTGGTTGNTQTHNLGGIPEMIITKALSGGTDSGVGHWGVYHSGLTGGSEGYIRMNRWEAEMTNPGQGWTPTATTFNPMNWGNPGYSQNDNGTQYLAMLFRSVQGISKVGTYTGQATDLDLNLGFTPRFFMVKNITTGVEYITNWAFWDNRRGIATGNDSFLTFNVKNRDTRDFDLLDPIANGIRIKSVAGKGNNPNNGTVWSNSVNALGSSFDQPISRSFMGAYPIAGPDAIWDDVPFSRTAGNYITVKGTPTITVDAGQKVIVYTAEDSTAKVTINNTVYTSSSGKVHEFAQSGQLTEWEAQGNSTQGRTYFTGISVNGWLLRDNCNGGDCGGEEMTNKTGDKYIYYAHA